MKKHLFFVMLISGLTMSSALSQDSLSVKRSFFNVNASFSFFRGYQAQSDLPNVNRNGYNVISSSDFRVLYNMYIIKSHLSIGAGFAISRTFQANFNQMWSFFDLRGYLSDENNTVYIFINFGKSFPVSNLWLNGQGAGIGIGYRFEWENRLFGVEINPFNRSVSFDNERYRDSSDKMNIFSTNLGISIFL